MDCTHCNQVELKECINKISHAWNDLLLGVPNRPVDSFTKEVREAIVREHPALLALSKAINAASEATW